MTSVFEGMSSSNESSSDEEQGLKLNLDREKSTKRRSNSYVVSSNINFGSLFYSDFILTIFLILG